MADLHPTVGLNETDLSYRKTGKDEEGEEKEKGQRMTVGMGVSELEW